MKAENKIFAAAAALLTLFGTAVVPCLFAAAETAVISEQSAGIVHISSAETLSAFSAECIYDKNSKGKKYVLDCDVTVTEDFLPIASFSGEFDGNGHCISGLKLKNDGSELGMFRYIEESGVVKNLRVNGNICPGGSALNCGGIAAVNRGKIINCSFSGVIKGTEVIGGIAGTNEETGIISACSSEGVVHGNKSTGGIAGKNDGKIISCENLALVNTEIDDSSFSLTDISLDDLGFSDRSADIADIGGIAGLSVGTLQNCTNKGTVGYSHVGYNVGGIAGRQSGYISGCVNHGEIFGRKDTGGIAGQAEPYTSVFFAEKKLDTLRTELNSLSDSIADVADHTETRSGTATDDMDDIINRLDRIKTSTDNLLDETDRIISYNVDSVNEISSRVSDFTAMLAPAVNSYAAAADSLNSSVYLITEAADCLKDSMESADMAFDELVFVTEDLNDSVKKFRDASDSLEESMEALQRAVGDPAAMEKYVKNLSESLDDMGKALKGLSYSCDNAVTDIAGFFADCSEKISFYKPQIINALQTISANAKSMGSDFEMLSGSLSWITSTDPSEYNKYLENFGSSMSNITSGASVKVFAAFGEISDALYGILSDGAEQDYSSYASDGNFVNVLNNVGKNLHDMGNSSDGLFSSLSDITGEIDVPSFNDTVEFLKAANRNIDEAADYIQNIIEAFDAAGDYFDDSFVSALAAVTAISSASDDIKAVSENLAEALGQTAVTFDWLSSLEKVEFMSADDTLIDCGDMLNDDITELLELLKNVSDNADVTSDVLADDLRTVNEKARNAYNTLLDMADDLSNASTDIEDYKEDISAEDTAGFSNGKIASCMNYGDINADVNAGGITGTMGVDVEFDPESDIQISGERSIDFIMKSKTVTRDCINYGNVTSKKDGAGGIAGNIETGCLINCTAYGFIGSTDGSYVGGAAGKSGSAVHGCMVMAHLNGGDYVGGICGLGKDMTDCLSYVIIDGSDEYSGMISGYADMYSEDNTITNNAFVDISAETGKRSQGAVDGISYENRAYPITYAQMTESYTLPSAFTDLKLTFTADGKTVETIHFDFGDSLSEDKIPDIPHKDGHYAMWEDFDKNLLVFSEEIKADYHKYITAVSSAEKRGNDRSVFILEGNFSSKDKIYAAAKEGGSDSCTNWTLTIPEAVSDKNSSYVVRYLPAKGTNGTILKITVDGIPYSKEITADGSYFVFRSSGTEISVSEIYDSSPYIITAVSCAAAGAAAVAAAVIMRRKNKKAKRR